MPLRPNTVHLEWDRPPGLSPSCYKCVLTYYERHLPHWQPEGTALFLTWRLHGSFPRTVGILRNQSAGQALAVMDRELDRAGAPPGPGPRWLLDERVAQCVADALRYGERQLGLYELRAWVLMVNHVHILIYPKAKLSRITKAVKNFSARRERNDGGGQARPAHRNDRPGGLSHFGAVLSEQY